MIYWKALTGTGKLIAIALFALFVIAVLAGGYSVLTGRSKAEARLGKNQTEAAGQSGQDAVNTVGKAGEREADSADLTRSNDVEIRNAQGADAAVDPAVRDAGFASVCRRASNRNDPKCVQRADSR